MFWASGKQAQAEPKAVPLGSLPSGEEGWPRSKATVQGAHGDDGLEKSQDGGDRGGHVTQGVRKALGQADNQPST